MCVRLCVCVRGQATVIVLTQALPCYRRSVNCVCIMCVRLCVCAWAGYCDRPDAGSAVLQAQCELSNDKKLAAKRVSELSAELFFAVFIRVTSFTRLH